VKAYSDEISSITSRSIIRKGMRQIAVSKIYVDEQGIRAASWSLLEESFTRYKEMASLSNIDTLRMLDPQALQLYYIDSKHDEQQPISIAELIASDVKIVTTSHLSIFKDLFLDIRDRFIPSGEHGLDAYLSARIRHGVLQNQIRSPFEASHLISEKDTTSGEYLENAYWYNKILAPTSVYSEVQKQLAVFSQTVDDIALKLNKEMVQVKTERKNSRGLFDYSFDDGELFIPFCDEFSEVTEFDPFLDGIFQNPRSAQ
jgi:hypothetical protein